MKFICLEVGENPGLFGNHIKIQSWVQFLVNGNFSHTKKA